MTMKTNKFLILMLLVFMPMIAFSNPPKKVILSYDKESGNIIVSAVHPVKDVNDHFIITVEVKANSEDAITLNYTSQSSEESQDVKIEMPDLKSGDIVEVKATCNKFGSKSESLTIE